MIEETAVVSKVIGGQAWVEATPQTACGSCAQKTGCSTSALEKYLKKRCVEVESSIDLKAGDHVIVGVDERALLMGSLMLYILPLLALFVAAVVGEWLAVFFAWPAQELISVIGAFMGFTLSLIVIRNSQNSFVRRHRVKPVVLRKV